jgi:hypothetical protein
MNYDYLILLYYQYFVYTCIITVSFNNEDQKNMFFWPHHMHCAGNMTNQTWDRTNNDIYSICIV